MHIKGKKITKQYTTSAKLKPIRTQTDQKQTNQKKKTSKYIKTQKKHSYFINRCKYENSLLLNDKYLETHLQKLGILPDKSMKVLERMDAEFEARVEAKAHELFSRVEEQRQLTELQEKLRNWRGNDCGKQLDASLLEYLKKTSEIILHSVHLSTQYECNDGDFNVFVVITNKNVLAQFPSKDCLTGAILSDMNICPLYSFASLLNLKQTQLLWNMINYNYDENKAKHTQNRSLKSQKRMETIIRTIPGKYSNGHWKQLDGFFGAYLNEDTMQVYDVPPSIDM
jgi:hypothetical protein